MARESISRCGCIILLLLTHGALFALGWLGYFLSYGGLNLGGRFHMQTISDCISWVFTYIFFPTIYFSVFVILILIIIAIILSARSKDKTRDDKVARLVVSAILPFICLAFFIVMKDEKDEMINKIIAALTNNGANFLVSFFIGVFICEISRFIQKWDKEILLSLFVLFLSLIVAFLLYLVVVSFNNPLHYIVMGLVSGSGLDIVFRGLPIKNIGIF
jgi:hypothetical protein